MAFLTILKPVASPQIPIDSADRGLEYRNLCEKVQKGPLMDGLSNVYARTARKAESPQTPGIARIDSPPRGRKGKNLARQTHRMEKR